MMKRETFAIANIYVPVKRRATLDPKKAQEIAESILQVGLQSPILVRQDGERFVLVEGLHRLEACKQLARKPSSDKSCRRAGINGLRLGARWRRDSPSLVARREWPERNEGWWSKAQSRPILLRSKVRHPIGSGY